MNSLGVIGYPLLAIAALNFSIAVVLLARPRRDPLARYAGAVGLINATYCFVVAMAYIRAAAAMPYDVYYRAAWVGWIGMAPMAQIILTLEGDATAAARWGRRLYAIWGSIWVLCLTTNLIEGGAVSLVPFVDRVGPLEHAGRAAGALTLCWMLFQLYRVQRVSAGRRRQQIAYFLVGLAVYAVAGLLLAGILQIVGGTQFDPALVSYFSLAWMAFTFYAITRHRLFDIRFVVSRVLLAVILTALLIGMQAVLFSWTSPVLGESAAIVLVSGLAGITLFSTPLVALLERGVEFLLVRRRYDYRSAMKESVRVLASVGTVDDVVFQLLTSVRNTVGNTCAVLLLRDGEVFRARQSYGITASPELPASSALARWMIEHPAALVREEQELGLAPELFGAIDAELRAFDGEVAVAMRYRDEVIGILIAGPKADKDAFLQADIDLLETLADEAAIAVTNARLLEDLQQAVRARDDFVSIAGHELRTPLSALHLSVEAAIRFLPQDDAARDRLQAAERQVRRISRLADELLDASRITAGRMTLEREPTDLAALVQEVTARLSDQISRSGSRLDVQASAAVIGRWDRLRIEQVVNNLIANAVKYGGGQPITVRVERSGDHARLTVRDLGIGIAAVDQERIFDRFERAVSSQHAGGFGLGLWITKQIIEAHAGTIRVDSEPEAGSTFTVELPLG